jgi:hypothetical protein
MLSEPMRAPQHRVQALIYLSTVLARYHRFPDAIVVQEHLLDHVNLDAPPRTACGWAGDVDAERGPSRRRQPRHVRAAARVTTSGSRRGWRCSTSTAT